MNSIPSIHDVKNYVQGNINYHTKQSLPNYQLEQIELRKYLCSSCANSLTCSHCGCKSPNLFYAPTKIDALQKWAQFLSQQQWEALKNNIDQYAEFFKVLRDQSRSSAITSSTASDIN